MPPILLKVQEALFLFLGGLNVGSNFSSSFMVNGLIFVFSRHPHEAAVHRPGPQMEKPMQGKMPSVNMWRACKKQRLVTVDGNRNRSRL